MTASPANGTTQMRRKPTGDHEPTHALSRWRRWLLVGAAAALVLPAWRGVMRDTEYAWQPAAATPSIVRPPALSPPIFESTGRATLQPAPQPEPRHLRAASELPLRVSHPEGVESTRERPFVDSTAPAAAASASTRAARSETIETEICDFGMVTLPANESLRVQRLPPEVRKGVFERVDALMLAHDDVQVRAAALLIGARSRGRQARERVDRLARLASASQDPAVYAMALEACQGWPADDGGACPLLTRAQWVRLDPDNVLPWLELAAEAQQRNEPQAEAEAMQHAGLARRAEAYEGLLPSLVERALGSQAPPLQRNLALSASWNVQTVWALSRSSHAYSYCASEAAPGAEERRHSCEAIAQTLAQRKLRLAELGVGLAIGNVVNGLGWSVERLQALAQVNDAISAISGLQTIGLDLSCAGVARMQDWLRILDARGELPAIRELLAQAATAPERPARRAKVPG